MTQQEERRSENAQPAEAAAEVAAEGRRRLEDFSEARTEIWDQALRKLRMFLDPVERDAERVREQRQKQRGKKDHSLRTLEVECIGKGKMQCPNEFGVKVSAATTLHPSKGAPVAGPVKRCQASRNFLAHAVRRHQRSPPQATTSPACVLDAILCACLLSELFGATQEITPSRRKDQSSRTTVY